MRGAGIPAEAVDAAVDALLGSGLGNRPGINGEEFVEAAIAALEAAAPHLVASLADEREGDLFRFTLSQREWLRKGLTK